MALTLDWHFCVLGYKVQNFFNKTLVAELLGMMEITIEGLL